jgi:hypothetical protein
LSFFTRFRQRPDTATPAEKEGLTPHGPPENASGEASDGPLDEALDEAAVGQEPAEDADGSEAGAVGAVDEAAAGQEAAGDADRSDASPDEAVVAGGWRDSRPALARTLSWGTTGLAAALVFVALLMPNETSLVTPSAFAHLPVEAIAGAALLLVLPPTPRRVVALLAGVSLGLLTLLNFLDMGFYLFLDRQFDLVLDWILLDDAEALLGDSIGQTAALGVVIVLVLFSLALPVVMARAVLRLSGLMARNRMVATRTTLVFGTVWVTLLAFGGQVAGTPVASRRTSDLVQERARMVNAGLKDEKAFAKEAKVDAFRDTPSDQLLTGLKGKDVTFAFIESYGRSAVEDPAMASQVGKVLTEGTSRLNKAGFSSRSGWLTSPVSGAGSWKAHTTLLSGTWVTNEQRYRAVTSSDRLTLNRAFRRTGHWRTVGVMPGVTRAWPEGKFFGFDQIYDSKHMGYHGPKFSWSPVPDQFSLAAFERLEHGKKNHKPLMTEIVLATSHNPWAPLPRMIGWDELGDGSVYHAIKKEGKDPKEVWKDSDKVRTEYRRSIEYSVNSLVSYVEKYGDDNTVLVFLGDHQPNSTVTGSGPDVTRDVPISIVAHDPAVLKQMSGWGWNDGLKPSPTAPVWKMDTFRDRFLSTYSPKVTTKPHSAQAR